MMGVSRDTFYRYKDAADGGGIEALFHKSRRIPNIKKRVDLQGESTVIQYAIDDPAHGLVRVFESPPIYNTPFSHLLDCPRYHKRPPTPI